MDYVKLEERIAELEKQSVTNIMVAVVPGDGSGHEVYAKSVADVEDLLSRLSEKAEDFDLQTVPLRQRVAELEVKLAKASRQRDEFSKGAERWNCIELMMLLGNVELNHDEDGGYSVTLDPAENLLGVSFSGNSPEEVIDAAMKVSAISADIPDETTVPALVFYPAGSLGEEVSQ